MRCGRNSKLVGGRNAVRCRKANSRYAFEEFIWSK